VSKGKWGRASYGRNKGNISGFGENNRKKRKAEDTNGL
jgi:hypothetical protein